MKNIEKLITQHCPNGAAYVCLGEITYEHKVRNTGRTIKEVRSVTNSAGLVRTNDYFSNTRTSQDTSNYKVVNQDMFVYNPSRINVGSIARHNEVFSVIVSPMYVVVGVDGSKLYPEYLGLFLESERGKHQILSKVEVGARFRLTYKAFSQISLPLPPIEVQKEIVRILNNFIMLEENLKAELNARKLQYEHYRDVLLGFQGNDDVRWTTMANVGEFFRGRRFTKKDYVDDGVDCIHYGDIYTKYGTYTTAAVTSVRSDMVSSLRFASPGDLVIAGVGETVDDVGKAVAWLGDGDVAIHDDCFVFHHSLAPKFVSYYFQTSFFHAEKKRYVARAKVKRLSAKNLGKLAIPVPSIAEQNRIVDFLEKFDALVNDISIGLPAELNARRKQYEYYRDKLLTFKPLEGAHAN